MSRIKNVVGAHYHDRNTIALYRQRVTLSACYTFSVELSVPVVCQLGDPSFPLQLMKAGW